MEIQNLTASAIAVLATYLQQIASGVAKRVQDSAVDRLYRIVASRMRMSAAGARILAELEVIPQDRARQAAAAAALSDSVAADPAATEELRHALEVVRIEQHTTGASGSAVRGANVAVGQHGTLSMHQGAIAGGDVDQSRRIKLSFGGLVVLVLAVAVAAAGVGATTTYLFADPRPSSDGGSTGVGACRPQPCASNRAGVTVLLKEVAVVDSRDIPSQSLLRFNWQIMNNSEFAVDYDEYINAYDDSHVKIDLGGFNSPVELDGCRSGVEVQVPPGQTVSSPGPACYSLQKGQTPASVELTLGLLHENIVVPLAG